MSTSHPTYKVHAGKFDFDAETKKVKVSKAKGLLTFFTNEQFENHISWANLETNLEELDIIVFPFDAKLAAVPGKNNTYVLKFESNEDRFFFYLQEKIDPEEFVQKANERITYEPMIPEEPQPEQKQTIPVEAPKQEQKPKTFNEDFITRLTNNLIAAQKKENNDITHLSKILTPDVINNFLLELTEAEKNEMFDNLPQEQKGAQHIAPNLRSAQFQQAADALSDALNSENVFPLFMQMGLDQKYLKKHYGVHAFLLALQEKYKEKKEE